MTTRLSLQLAEAPLVLVQVLSEDLEYLVWYQLIFLFWQIFVNSNELKEKHINELINRHRFKFSYIYIFVDSLN